MKIELKQASSGSLFAMLIISIVQISLALLNILLPIIIKPLVPEVVTASSPSWQQFLAQVASMSNANQPLLVFLIVVLPLAIYALITFKTIKAVRSNKNAHRWLITSLVASSLYMYLGDNTVLIAIIGAILGLISFEKLKSKTIS